MNGRKIYSINKGVNMVLAFLLMVSLVSNAWSNPVYIDDCDGSDMGGSWATGTTTQNYTAEASPYGLELAAGGDTYSISGGADWGGYQGYYLGFYLCSPSAGNTLDIIITEEDSNLAGSDGEPQPWDLTTDISINWTGWRYIMVRLPNGTTPNDFQTAVFTALEVGEADFNPGEAGGQKWDGVISVEFKNNSATNKLFIDEINLCQSNPVARLELVFPEHGAVLRRLPPTISARSAVDTDVTNEHSNIWIIQKDPNLADSNYYSIDDLVDFPNDSRHDGSRGLLCTPNDMVSDSGGWGSYRVDNEFIIFVMPANANGDFGQASVTSFAISAPDTAVGTSYHRELTN